MDISNNSEDKRRFARIPFINRITLSYADRTWEGDVVDISFKGILITSDDTSLVNNAGPIDALIQFESGIDITARLELAHHHDKFYGFHFQQINNDSLSHLRHIMMHNLGDESACNREFMSLFNSHL